MRALSRLLRAASISRGINSIARWRLTGSTSYEKRARYIAMLLCVLRLLDQHTGWPGRCIGEMFQTLKVHPLARLVAAAQRISHRCEFEPLRQPSRPAFKLA